MVVTPHEKCLHAWVFYATSFIVSISIWVVYSPRSQLIGYLEASLFGKYLSIWENRTKNGPGECPIWSLCAITLEGKVIFLPNTLTVATLNLFQFIVE